MTQQSSSVTTDHGTIRNWIENRGGVPATVAGTGRAGEEAGMLRIDFPERNNDPNLEQISWRDFFDKFEESRLAFLYQDKTVDGKPSRFNKFIRREN